MSFAVFLDVDGVLNSRTTCETTPKGSVGIDDLRALILARAIRKYGPTDIVLSSDWKELPRDDDDWIYLNEKLNKQGLTISDTTKDSWSNRGQGIWEYLSKHPEIDEYVVIDDNKFDFQSYNKIWERLILTKGIENSEFASKSPAIEAMIFRDYLAEASGKN